MKLFSLKIFLFLFVIIINSHAQKANRIKVIHLYSFHSFNSFSQNGIIDMSKGRKISQQKIDQKKVPNCFFDFGVVNKYVEGLNKIVISSQIDSIVERLKLDDEIRNAIDRHGPVYPFGTFLIAIEDKNRKILNLIKVNSIENLMTIFNLYINQYSSKEDKEFVSKHVVKWLLSGYEFDLEILNEK